MFKLYKSSSGPTKREMLIDSSWLLMRNIWRWNGTPHALATPQTKYMNLISLFLRIPVNFQCASKIETHYSKLVALTWLHIELDNGAFTILLKTFPNHSPPYQSNPVE